MANKTVIYVVVILALIPTLTCKRWKEVSKNDTPIIREEESRTFQLAGKDWNSYDLDQTDIKVELPGSPKDQSPQMPESYKAVFSAMHIHSYDEKDFASSFTELVPSGKRSFTIKELADTSMIAFKRQRPDLTYTLDIKSEANAKISGEFTRNGKSFDLRGCCIYRKGDPSRVWAVLTLYPKDNADGRNAGQRIIDSVVFKDSTELCK